MSEERKLIQVWNVEVSGHPVRVATAQHGPRKQSMCDGCSAPCCKGKLRPVLTAEEFKERKFPTLFLVPPEWMQIKVPRAQAIATLGNFTDKGCGYFDHDTGLCTIWPNCPQGCLSYDCNEDTRPEILAFAKRRAKQCRAQ